jgi:hypothetical protein
VWLVNEYHVRKILKKGRKTTNDILMDKYFIKNSEDAKKKLVKEFERMDE